MFSSKAAIFVLLASVLNIEATPYHTKPVKDGRCNSKGCSISVFQSFTSGDPVKAKIFNPNNPSVPIVIDMNPIKIQGFRNPDEIPREFQFDGRSTHYVKLAGRERLPGDGYLSNYKIEFSQSGASSNVELIAGFDQSGAFVITPRSLGNGKAIKTAEKAWFEQ